MALTSKLGLVSKISINSRGEPNLDNLEPINAELFEMIKNSGRFPIALGTRLLDIGCGYEGSDFVNRYAKAFPGIEVVYLDRGLLSIEKLEFPNKVLADATNMPFQDESFDIAYAGGILPYGILKKSQFTGDESYKITEEAYRILKKNGLFVFAYVLGEDAETLANLAEIGFRRLEHLQRIECARIPVDTYAARK